MLLLLIISIMAPFADARPVSAQPSQPNIVLIVVDGMRAVDYQALPKTRNWLAGGGTTFPNFIATTPACCPSRSSILTGLYTSNHGVLTNQAAYNGGIATFIEQGWLQGNLGVWMDDAGYKTAMIGKYLNGYSSGKPPGWDDWRGLRGTLPYDFALFENDVLRHYRGDRQHQSDVLAAKAERFIATSPTNRPLFLYFAPTAPHSPAIAPLRHQDAFRNRRVERVPSFLEEDTSDKPAYVRAGGSPTRQEIAQLDAEHRGRLQSMLGIDDAVMRVRRARAEANRLDNTVVFFVSDNGFLLGHHNRYGKGVPYDGAVRIPMLAWGLGFAGGQTNQRLVANIDLAPTIAALGEAVAGHPMDGVPIFAGNRSELLIEFFAHPRPNPNPGKIIDFVALRTIDHLYVEYSSGECELYDYRTDPYELENQLAGGKLPPPDLAARLSALTGKPSTGCPTPTGSAAPAEGQAAASAATDTVSAETTETDGMWTDIASDDSDRPTAETNCPDRSRRRCTEAPR
jgi:arylsulfatase A-like enzyme